MVLFKKYTILTFPHSVNYLTITWSIHFLGGFNICNKQISWRYSWSSTKGPICWIKFFAWFIKSSGMDIPDDITASKKDIFLSFVVLKRGKYLIQKRTNFWYTNEYRKTLHYHWVKSIHCITFQKTVVYQVLQYSLVTGLIHSYKFGF